jgi:hypothetical protein
VQELSAANKTALSKQLQRFIQPHEKLQIETKVCDGADGVDGPAG